MDEKNCTTASISEKCEIEVWQTLKGQGSKFPECHHSFLCTSAEMFPTDKCKSFYHDLYHHPFLLIRNHLGSIVLCRVNIELLSIEARTQELLRELWKNRIQDTGSCGENIVEDALILVDGLSCTYFQ